MTYYSRYRKVPGNLGVTEVLAQPPNFATATRNFSLLTTETTIDQWTEQLWLCGSVCGHRVFFIFNDNNSTITTNSIIDPLLCRFKISYFLRRLTVTERNWSEWYCYLIPCVGSSSRRSSVTHDWSTLTPGSTNQKAEGQSGLLPFGIIYWCIYLFRNSLGMIHFLRDSPKRWWLYSSFNEIYL